MGDAELAAAAAAAVTAPTAVTAPHNGPAGLQRGLHRVPPTAGHGRRTARRRRRGLGAAHRTGHGHAVHARARRLPRREGFMPPKAAAAICRTTRSKAPSTIWSSKGASAPRRWRARRIDPDSRRPRGRHRRRLGGQAEVKGVAGTWRISPITSNSWPVTLTAQVRNIAAVTKAVASGDLSKKITPSTSAAKSWT